MKQIMLEYLHSRYIKFNNVRLVDDESCGRRDEIRKMINFIYTTFDEEKPMSKEQNSWKMIDTDTPVGQSLLFHFKDGSVAEGEYKVDGSVVQYRWSCVRHDADAWRFLPKY